MKLNCKNTVRLKAPAPHRSREDTPEEMVILQLVKDALLEEESSVGLPVRNRDGDLHFRGQVVPVDCQPPVHEDTTWRY